MKKFLIVIDWASGMAEIGNVGLVTAETAEDAKQQTIVHQRLQSSARRFVEVYDLAEKDNWWYFE